jgi:predicted porin
MLGLGAARPWGVARDARPRVGRPREIGTVALVIAAIGLSSGEAAAADLPTTKPPPPPTLASTCFASFYDFLNSTPADCPLTWNGITLYGAIDVGAGYSSHGANFNRDYPQAVAEVIAKYSQGAKWQLVPNGLQRSNVGVKIREEFAPGWSFVGNVNTDFDPYSLRLANGPASLVDNNNQTIGNQNANSDSSRAGQWDNTVGFVGLSNTTYGTLTVGRQNSFSADLVTSYDPMSGAYAFSLIGNSATYVSGVGDTETTRYNSTVKYQVAYNGFRAGAVWQFGGYSLGNGSDGAVQVDLGGDFAGFSIDGVYSYARDAVSLSTYSANPLPAGVSQDDLKATLADINGGVLGAKYKYGPFTAFGGYEYAVYSPPSNAYPGGFGALGDYTVLPGAANSTAYINNKHLQVVWIGGKYALRPDLDLSGAYYHAHQNDYRPPGSLSTVCGPNTKAPVTGASPQGSLNSYCEGGLNAASALLDYRPVKRIDLYAGVLYSIASGGIASGYIHSNNIAPTAGLRVSF